jgi:hypothetical protein
MMIELTIKASRRSYRIVDAHTGATKTGRDANAAARLPGRGAYLLGHRAAHSRVLADGVSGRGTVRFRCRCLWRHIRARNRRRPDLASATESLSMPILEPEYE